MPRKPRRSGVPSHRTASAPYISKEQLGIAAALAGAILLIYWQVLSYRFINLDDDAYILNNPPVRGGLTFSGIEWAFTSVRHFYWQPLTWLSHMLDCQLYGLNPGGHHFTNVLLHAANAVLVFALLCRMTGFIYRSAFVAALFALHPLRVESVAWIAERKDVLSAFFCLLSLFLYVRYVKQPSRGRYLSVLAAFGCALMSKPMAVTLPLVMLAIDYWPLRRTEPLGTRIREKLPLFLMSAIVSALTLLGQQEMGALAPLGRIGPWSRMGNAIIGYVEYVSKTIWPRDLAILYPFPAHLFLTRVLPALALLAAISALAVYERRRRPWLLIGWCWFVIVLAPTSGIFQAGDQAFADRFTYLPHIGLLIAIVWTVAEFAARSTQGRLIATVLAVAVLPALGLASWAQTRYWADSVTVAQHAIDVTAPNAVMEHNLGFALSQEGRRKEAIMHFSRSLAIEPRDSIAQYNLGKSLLEEGQPQPAEVHFRAAVRLNPGYADAHFALATVLSGRGAFDDAAPEFELALGARLSPAYAAEAHNDLGVMLARQNRFAEAATHFAEAARLNPQLIASHLNYARCLAAQNRSAEAEAYLNGVLRTDGQNPEISQYLNILEAQSHANAR